VFISSVLRNIPSGNFGNMIPLG